MAQAKSRAFTGIVRSTIADTSKKATAPGKAWAFAKGGLTFSLASGPAVATSIAQLPPPDLVSITQHISIQDAFVSQGSEYLLESTSNPGVQIANNLPGGLATEIAAAMDPMNPNVHPMPVQPSTIWFSVSASVDDHNVLHVTSSQANSASMPITEDNFSQTMEDGILGYTLNFEHDFIWTVPPRTVFDIEAALPSVDEPSSLLLAITGLLIVIGVNGLNRRGLHPR